MSKALCWSLRIESTRNSDFTVCLGIFTFLPETNFQTKCIVTFGDRTTLIFSYMKSVIYVSIYISPNDYFFSFQAQRTIPKLLLTWISYKLDSVTSSHLLPMQPSNEGYSLSTPTSLFNCPLSLTIRRKLFSQLLVWNAKQDPSCMEVDEFTHCSMKYNMYYVININF